MLYIIGINHGIQIKSNMYYEKDYKDFIEYTKNAIVEFEILIIAEEFNEDCLIRYRISESILKSVSKELSLTHVFIEPRTAKKIELGIDDFMEKNDKQKSFKLREKYWISQIQNHLNENILCFVGSSHKDSFSKLLDEKKIKYIFNNYEVL